uniref:Uncharacterized protein n=1 Tax=Arundo donax TaxID=35708 RepID=A0A0A8Z6B1_ARUDO
MLAHVRKESSSSLPEASADEPTAKNMHEGRFTLQATDCLLAAFFRSSLFSHEGTF